MLPKLLVNHLHNDLGELFLLLVIQGKYHFDYLFNLLATLHLLSPRIWLCNARTRLVTCVYAPLLK